MIGLLDRLPRRLARTLLGPARYAGLRALVRGEPTSIPSPAPSSDQALRARFKAHIIESLARRRALEKELARLKEPHLHCASLDVTAEIRTGGALPAEHDSVSVVITNYNYGRYLPVALRSVFAQTHRPLEALVIDDASTDGSGGTLRGLLGDDCPVPFQRVLLKHNVGPSAARNVGVRLARGRYVFILDADNHLLSDCLARHVETAVVTGADAVYGKIRKFGGPPGLLSAAPFSAERLAAGPYIDAMALFRRDALVEAGLYSVDPLLEGWEDYELWVRFAAQGRAVAFIPRVLSHYYSHPQSTIAMTNLDTVTTRRHLARAYPGFFHSASEAEARNLVTLERPTSGPDEDLARCDCGGTFEERAGVEGKGR